MTVRYRDEHQKLHLWVLSLLARLLPPLTVIHVILLQLLLLLYITSTNRRNNCQLLLKFVSTSTSLGYVSISPPPPLVFITNEVQH